MPSLYEFLNNESLASHRFKLNENFTTLSEFIETRSVYWGWTYNSAITYEKWAIVVYGGEIYISKNLTTGIVPTNTSNWDVFLSIDALIDWVQNSVYTHITRSDNPHSVTKSQVWLSNVDNTSDADKPISTATATEIGKRVTYYTVGFSNADYIVDGIADNVQIQQAIDAAAAAWGGIVFIRQGTYSISGRMTPKNNVTILGTGKGATNLVGGVASDWMFYNTLTLSNFSIQHITLNCNFTSSGGIMGLSKITNGLFFNVEFKNVSSGGWNAVIGLIGTTWPIDCFNNTFENCTFDNHSGTLEMLLLMNAENTHVTNCVFKNKITTWPVVGLYQLLNNTTIEWCIWQDNVGFAMYYSVSCNNTVIRGNFFGNGGWIQGANLSDNGNFGETYVRGFTVVDNFFVGWPNSSTSQALQLGATNGAIVKWNTFSWFNIGVLFDDWNTGIPAIAINWILSSNTFYNNTASNVAHSINPAVLFSAMGGSCYGTIINNKFFDNQWTATQRYPISFYNIFTWDYIDIINNRLSAYGGWTSIGLISGAIIGSNVNIYWNSDYSGANPVQRRSFSLTNDTLTWTIAEFNLACSDANFVDDISIQNIGGTKTFTNVIKNSSATSLEIGTGWGSTPNLINMGWGWVYIGQVNANLMIRPWFGAKNVDILDSGSFIQFSIAFDSGKITFLTSSNKPAGSATLVWGTVTVNNTLVTANSIIMISRRVVWGTPWYLSYTRTAGNSFTVTSTSGTDTSTFDYIIFN
mgnify:FL=1